MLLFLGGAARTGKGLLTRRLLCQHRLPYLSLDVLKMGLTRGMPELAIDPDAGALVVATRLWPLVREMSHNLIGEALPYVIEGELLPQNVAGLREQYGTQVAACFLGYATITPAQKLADLRAYPVSLNEWPRTVADPALLQIIAREIAFSQYLQTECQIYDFPYFDSSADFTQTLEQVVAFVEATFSLR